MDNIMRPHASYHIIGAEQYPLSDFAHHKQAQQSEFGFKHEGENPFDQRPNYRIPRKPVSYSDATSDLNGADSLIRDELRDPGEQKPQAWWRIEVLSIWWLELVCCFLSAGAFVAIVVTIWTHEGRPLPDWPYHLNINTLIAIYVVILKAALLLVTAQGLGQLKWRWFERERPLDDLTAFDGASRGAWGSLTLLWMLKGRHIIASCGAFITIAALLVDPFAQQVISSYQCMLPVQSSQATIPRTNYFYEVGPHTGAGESALPVDLQRVINGGIFNPGTQVKFNCPTGNCTFPEIYHSVGYCSSCNDTTDKLSITNEIVPASPGVHAYNYTNVTIPGYWTDYHSNSQNYSSWTPPETAVLNLTVSGYTNTAYLLMDYANSAVVASALNGTTSCSGDHPLHWGCDISVANEGSFGVGAASCTIAPCIRSYKASIDAGTLSEETFRTTVVWDEVKQDDNAGGLLSATINVACLPNSTEEQLSKLEFKVEQDGWLSTPNLTSSSDYPYPTHYWVPTNDPTAQNISIPTECVYVFEYLTNNGIQEFFDTYLNGTVGVSPYSAYSYDYAGAPQLLAIYNNGNLGFEDLTEIYANISDSLTQYIRQNGAQNFSSPAAGAVLHEQTCVRVRWAWLSYPAVLIVLTLFFLTAMIIETRKGEGRSLDWKSEPLALMFHRLDDEAIGSTHPGRLIKRSGMQDTAKRIYVRLGRNKEGWGFIGRRQDGVQREVVEDVGEADEYDRWRK